jgi:hypothetical protein
MPRVEGAARVGEYDRVVLAEDVVVVVVFVVVAAAGSADAR